MNKVKNIALWITAVFAAISTIYGAYSFFSRKIVTADRKEQNDIIYIQAVNKLIKSDSLLILQFSQVVDTLNKVKETQDMLLVKQNKLNASFVKHLKLSEKVDELINFYELQK
jgi:hypothetical protein